MKTDWLHQKFKMKVVDGPITFIDVGNAKIEIIPTKISKGSKLNKIPRF